MSAASERYFYLTPVLGGPGAPRYPIKPEPQLIGRSERAAIPLLEPSVSREHATVCVVEGGIHLEDLGSKHGTFVNSKRITLAKLRVGDIIVFGLSLVLRLEESDNPVPPPPGLELSDGGNTVSLAAPLPQTGALPRRHQYALSSPKTAAHAAHPSYSDTELLKEKVVRSAKLAAAGALCATVIPELKARCESLCAKHHNIPELTKLAEDISAMADALSGYAVAHQCCNVMELLRHATQIVQPEAAVRGIDMMLNVPSHITVTGDSDRLLISFVELLRHAASSNPDGQPVEIRASSYQDTTTISIRDYGDGLPSEILMRGFDPLMTLRSDWQRLDLCLFEARHHILAQGGQLCVESAPEHGSTVLITLRQ